MSRRTVPAAWRFGRSPSSSPPTRASCRARVSRATYYGAKVEYEVMLGDQPTIVEVYNPQLTERFTEGDEVYMTLIDRCVRVLR